VAAIFAYVEDQSQQMMDEVDAVPSMFYYNVQLPFPAPPRNVAIPIVDISAGEMLAAESSARVLRRSARDQRYSAARSQAIFAAQAAPAEMINVFVARDGQDLRRVATQFYGSPASWRDLANYNGVSASRLSAGQLVFVPRAPPTPTAQGIPKVPATPTPQAT
jgi:hypothetical protein